MTTYPELLSEIERQACERQFTLDLGYQSALFLLGQLLPDDRISRSISVSHGEVRFDWPALYEEHSFSTGERLIVSAARSLFSGADDGPGLGELATHLDATHLTRVLDAVRIRAGLPVPAHI